MAGAGYVLSGGHGVQDFARTAVSLVQLVLLLVPLTALLIGVLSLAPERGAAELLFSQPVSRRTILLGKLLGLFQALAAAQAVGFGAAGVVVYAQSGPEGLGGFLLLVGASLVTTAVFLGLAALLSAGAVGRKRTRALALALVVWFVAVVLFDLAALGLASLLPSGTASRVLMVSAIVNPVGAVRTGTLLAIEGTGAFGAASLALFRFTRGAWGAGRRAGPVARSSGSWRPRPSRSAACGGRTSRSADVVGLLGATRPMAEATRTPDLFLEDVPRRGPGDDRRSWAGRWADPDPMIRIRWSLRRRSLVDPAVCERTLTDPRIVVLYKYAGADRASSPDPGEAASPPACGPRFAGWSGASASPSAPT